MKSFNKKTWVFWGNWMGLILSLTWVYAERPQHCTLVGMETTLMVSFEKIIVYMPGKFLFLPFLPFLGQKYIAIACGDIYIVLGCFWSFSSKPLMFLVNFCYLNYVYSLGMINEKLSFNKKNWATWGNWMGLILSLTWANAERPQHCTLVGMEIVLLIIEKIILYM